MSTCSLFNNRFLRVVAGLSFATLLIAGSLFGKGIRVEVAPSTSQPVAGEQLSVAITLDLSAIPDALGSYTATVRWNPQALKYLRHSGGTSEGFATPLVNANKANSGELAFAAANPYGGKGVVNILNLRFEVTGAQGIPSGLMVEFSAMAAAFSFTDLLPQVEPMVTGVEDVLKIGDMPATFALLQNQPNPFNPETEIQYELPRQSRVVLSVFNLLGQRIKTLVSGTYAAGMHSVRWNGTDDSGRLVPSGVYIYRMEAPGFVQKRKMTLLQ